VGASDNTLKVAAGLVLAAWLVLALVDLAEYLAELERRLSFVERGPVIVRGPWKERAHDEPA
jgi:hypothetical protein